MTKIKIGENEYEGPFDTESSAYDCPHRTVSDEAGNQVSSWDITIALNELATLRKENAELRSIIQSWVFARRDYQNLHPGNHTSEERATVADNYFRAERKLIDAAIIADTTGVRRVE